MDKMINTMMALMVILSFLIVMCVAAYRYMDNTARYSEQACMVTTNTPDCSGKVE